MAVLEDIVRNDEKSRYSFNEDKTKIRANQGHSVNVDVELEEAKPPEVLYHGTSIRFLDGIGSEGLKPLGGLYVHLSEDEITAEKVGIRHGKPEVLRVESGQMCEDGVKFYLSKNGVWLVDKVDVKYIKGL